MSEPKVRIISLDDLFDALGLESLYSKESAAEPLGAINDQIRRQQEFMDNFKKEVVRCSGEALEEFLDNCKANGCDHMAHRIIPIFAEDHRAVYNFLSWVADMQVDIAKRVALSAWDASQQSLKGTAAPPQYAVDALFGVLSAALLVGTTLAADISDCRDFHKAFDKKLREHMASSHEALLTGSMPVKRGKREHCH